MNGLDDVVEQLVALLDVHLERGHVDTRLLPEQLVQCIICCTSGGECMYGVARAEHPLYLQVRHI